MDHKFINLDYLNEMSGGDRNMILEMISIYITEVPGYVSRMKEYLKSGNIEALGKLAHKAKASASIMGATKLAEDLRELEQLAKDGEKVNLYGDYVKRIAEQFNFSIEELKKVSATI